MPWSLPSCTLVSTNYWSPFICSLSGLTMFVKIDGSYYAATWFLFLHIRSTHVHLSKPTTPPFIIKSYGYWIYNLCWYVLVQFPVRHMAVCYPWTLRLYIISSVGHFNLMLHLWTELLPEFNVVIAFARKPQLVRGWSDSPLCSGKVGAQKRCRADIAPVLGRLVCRR